MKIAFCAQSDSSSSQIDLRFGRTAFFGIYEETDSTWTFITNQQNLQAAQGAGIQSAQHLLDNSVDVLIASNVGPKAMAALQAGGIKTFKIDGSMSLDQALKAYQAGSLTAIDQANVQGHWM